MIHKLQHTYTILVLLFLIAGLGVLWAVPFSQAQERDIFDSPVPTPTPPDQGAGPFR